MGLGPYVVEPLDRTAFPWRYRPGLGAEMGEEAMAGP
jgi:hypothetical protein